MTAKKPTLVLFDPAQLGALDFQCQSLGCSRASFVRAAVDDWLRRYGIQITWNSAEDFRKESKDSNDPTPTGNILSDEQLTIGADSGASAAPPIVPRGV